MPRFSFFDVGSALPSTTTTTHGTQIVGKDDATDEVDEFIEDPAECDVDDRDDDDVCAPSDETVPARDRRAARTMDLIREYEERKRRWQDAAARESRNENRKSAEVDSGGPRDGFAGGVASSDDPANDASAAPSYAARASTTMPPAEIATESEFESDNDEATTSSRRIDDRLVSVQYISVENDDDDDKESSSQPANDIFFNDVVNSSAAAATHYDEYDGHAASASRSFTFAEVGTGTDAEQLLSPNWKTSLDIRAAVNFDNRRNRIQGKDLSSLADDDDTSASTTTTSSTSLSRLSCAPSSTMMEKVKENQPLGGPKYYVVVNTKKGRARIVHEGMPAAGREGFIMDMEEKGFEIMEYDLLVVPERRRRRHRDEKNDGNNHSSSTSSSSSSRSVSAPKAITIDDVVGTMDYDAFDESCASVTSMFETELITKKGHRANDVVANEAMMSNIVWEDLELAMKDDGYTVYEHDRADESPSPTNHGVDESSKMRKINPRDNSCESTGTSTKTKTKESTPRPRRAVNNLLRPRVEKYYTHVKEETANMKKAWVLSSDGPAKYRSTNTDQ